MVANFSTLPRHLWSAIFSHLEHPLDRKAVTMVSKLAASAAIETFRRSVAHTVSHSPTQLVVLASEAGQGFKHRQARVTVLDGTAQTLRALIHLTNLGVGVQLCHGRIRRATSHLD